MMKHFQSRIFGCVGLLHKKKKKILEKHFFMEKRCRYDVIMTFNVQVLWQDHQYIRIYEELRKNPGGIGF